MKIRQQIQGKINNIGTKNLLKTFSGIMLIFLVFVLNGFLSFIVVGFEWQRILTSGYWANFGLLSASEILVMYGMFLIQRTKDLQNPKVTDLQKEINKKRNVVYGADRVADAEDWLREIYNYKQRLLIYEKKIKSMYDKIRAVEPKQPVEPKESDANYKKKLRKYKANQKRYESRLKKYNKALDKKKYLQKQLEFIKIDKERMKLLINHASNVEIEKFNKQLENEDYLFNTAKIRYTDVYWGSLLSDIDVQGNKNATPHFNERSEVSKSLSRTIGIGCVVSAFTSALVAVGIGDTGWGFWINLVLNCAILITFLVRGIILSKNIILGKYFKALETRKAIYVAMLKDLGLSKIIIEGEEDE